jgi:hypothetical protein
MVVLTMPTSLVVTEGSYQWMLNFGVLYTYIDSGRYIKNIATRVLTRVWSYKWKKWVANGCGWGWIGEWQCIGFEFAAEFMYIGFRLRWPKYGALQHKEVWVKVADMKFKRSLTSQKMVQDGKSAQDKLTWRSGCLCACHSQSCEYNIV